MNQVQYKAVLQSKLIPQIATWYPNHESCVFMQDSAPCHTALSIRKFLMEKNIPLLPWPGNSPDLNPIENLWSIVKRRIRSENITTKLQLIDRLISVWHRDEEVQKICISAIESMPRRINAVINAKGGPTKY